MGMQRLNKYISVKPEKAINHREMTLNILNG